MLFDFFQAYNFCMKHFSLLCVLLEITACNTLNAQKLK